MEVEGGHWATHSCPGLAAKGHKPLGMSDPPTWGGVGQPTWLGACSWTGDEPGIFLVQGFIHPKINSLGADIGVPGRWWGAQPLSPAGACIPPQGAVGGPSPVLTPTEELQCSAGLLPTLLELVHDGVAAVVRLHHTQVSLL